MNELLIRILADGAILTGLAGLLAFFLKQWIAKSVEYQFSRRQELDKATLEVEKKRSLDLLARENAIYPEVVELVYRLRNDFRKRLRRLKQDYKNPTNWSVHPDVSQFGEELYILTERLYKYRAYLDEDVFQSLHKVKRNLQDAEVMFNKLNRMIAPDAPSLSQQWSEQGKAEFNQRCEDAIPILDSLFTEIDVLYPQITESVKDKMKSVLSRSERPNKPDAGDA